MKVFISFSGPRSQLLAEFLQGWLKKVIQRLDPWISTKGVPKGAQWAQKLFEELKTTNFGIICLTPENLCEPWLLFEAGALSKQVDRAFVVPYLFELNPTDFEGPLTVFQAARANKEDTRKLLEDINKALGKQHLPEGELEETFDLWWPKLHKVLEEIPPKETEHKRRRDIREIAEETLERIRNMEGSSIFSRPDVMLGSRQVVYEPPRQGIRLSQLGNPNVLRQILSQVYEAEPFLTSTPSVWVPSGEYWKTEEARPPEKDLGKVHGSGQAEAGKQTKKAPRRAHVPRKRR